MKKPNGEEKIGRSQGSNRDSNTPSKNEAAKKDVFQLFAEKVRVHKDFVSRWAALIEMRVEYFRGKDFVSFMRNHSELKDILKSDRSLEPEDIANILLKKKLLVRCDRVVKTVRPGKKKLSAFPSHLEIYDCQVFSEDDAFFAWTFVKRRTLWQTIISFFWPYLILAVWFFPVYPHLVKLLILYLFAGVFLLILCLLSLRVMVFCALWILLGYHVWFFPNILAEKATIKELFQFCPQKDDGKQPEWIVRIFYENVAVIVILLLRRHYAYDEAATASVGPYLDQPTRVLQPT